MTNNYLNYLDSFPSELEQTIEKNPIAYIPFGALEWHGEHNVLGVDSLKAEHILKRTAEETGGVLFPCVNWGAFGVMNFPYTFDFSKRCLKKLTKKLVKQLYEMGFRVIVLLTGHYPRGQIRQVRKACEKISKKYDNCFALGIPEQALATDMGYYGDHAAEWETSMMLAINQEYVDLTKLPEGLNFPERCIRHGVMGKDPNIHSSQEKGKQALGHIIKKLATAVNEVITTQSINPFDKIYREFDTAKKNLNLSNKLEVYGIKNKSEGLAYLKWEIFKRGEHNPDYSYTGK
ncbi:MAG: hypothetical protein GF383_02170 [Candidatus Lokiarchaeota archaeon]|nr:hypothetical protein [Candidatus Lokiarchaeota archaeon]MBD3338220.1 hypothetical protein [Candidatus Lokiarchaeota archaeon]